MPMTAIIPPTKRGRPPARLGLIRRGPQVLVRLREPFNSLLDEWIAQRAERLTRPEALRRLAAFALATFEEEEL
jgi:hypothetical protein